MFCAYGNKKEAEQVIAALEKMGGKNVDKWKGDDPESIYFIGRTGEIERTNNIDLIWILEQGKNSNIVFI